jgi:hypothetical protein
VIGPFLPLDKLYAGVDDARAKLAADGWEHAARAIMTTDTVHKLAIASYRLPTTGAVCVTLHDTQACREREVGLQPAPVLAQLDRCRRARICVSWSPSVC